MGSRLFAVALLSLLSCSISGCIFSEEKNNHFDLDVKFSDSYGIVVEKYFAGELESTNHVTIEFDLSSNGVDLETIGVDLNDGSSPIEMDGSLTSTITVQFISHGKYNVSVFATNDQNVRQTVTIPIIIDLRIEWIENSTTEPEILNFNPIPNNGGEHPRMIEIQSTVTNPSVLEDLKGGQSVQFSWTITDELGDTCQRNDAVVGDGESEVWETIHFNTYLIHDLSVIYEDGQDPITINQTLMLTYDS